MSDDREVRERVAEIVGEARMRAYWKGCAVNDGHDFDAPPFKGVVRDGWARARETQEAADRILASLSASPGTRPEQGSGEAVVGGAGAQQDLRVQAACDALVALTKDTPEGVPCLCAGDNVALQVLCRVFDDDPADVMQEWYAFDKSGWFWWGRALGAFIRRKIDANARPADPPPTPAPAPAATATPEVEKDDEGRPYQCGAFVSGDSRWECLLESDHRSDHEWRIRATPEGEPDAWRMELKNDAGEWEYAGMTTLETSAREWPRMDASRCRVVPLYAHPERPPVAREREVFDAGFRAGLREAPARFAGNLHTEGKEQPSPETDDA